MCVKMFCYYAAIVDVARLIFAPLWFVLNRWKPSASFGDVGSPRLHFEKLEALGFISNVGSPRLVSRVYRQWFLPLCHVERGNSGTNVVSTMKSILRCVVPGSSFLQYSCGVACVVSPCTRFHVLLQSSLVVVSAVAGLVRLCMAQSTCFFVV